MRYRQPFFQRKLGRAREAVAAGLAAMRKPYVAFSGGKDSLVCLALVLEQAPTVTVNWSDDELEHAETVAYNTSLASQMGFQFLVTAGYATHAGWFRPWYDRPYWRDPLPGTVEVGDRIETWMPKQGYDGTFLGLRKAENARRRQYLGAMGRLHSCVDGTWRCNPLAGWTVDDVWALIAGWKLSYNPVYDRLAAIGVPRKLQRVGPLPLSPAWHLKLGWPEVYRRLVDRYGPRWDGGDVR
jgi:3'-phosphoadenosine 5'-phosphosulfate sulfotransferase (PAPS reductase)/FAD synthetase